MNINIKAVGIELTPGISEYIYKKVGAVEKYLGDSTDLVAQVEVGRITEHHKTGEIYKAEIHITGKGLDLYAVSEKEDTYAAIDIVKDEIIREAKKVKGKRSTLARHGEELVKNMGKGFTWGANRLRFKGFKKK